MKAHPTSIEGLLRIELDLQLNADGWFVESFHRDKLLAAGGPAYDVVQHNVLAIDRAGVLRGIHAEPWDKYLAPSAGRLFVAIVELRANAQFGQVECFELAPGEALYVPRGCGNSFCTLEPHTVYNFLVNETWSPERITVDPFDPELAIRWPFPRAELSYTDRDASNPPLTEVRAQLV
ncbi:dTDP-4-keto-6-deoxy-D-glucose epimerase [Kribbella sandramycini]|uniref:dTDP-4-dehydrorhamnose 3,5-epimerase n=1 Tax=Kribbella sandramycini TaxID=60450 RepID=A0A7Y4L682_9ACTN|nr:dTDP-4-dehydrorhamnose 3,5-epimerase family protein [Kribbella sandramycini]MBB6566057.1 dTDP-4-dehydrorhamnose 3,5-epimerase [Kribbella sandramycini]NOL45058.1 dTDP-4-keto-6-deoxy-D-glucose epimerase [Kribbella sandramycini]